MDAPDRREERQWRYAKARRYASAPGTAWLLDSRLGADTSMLIIDHRVNTLEHLAEVPADRGVEIDVRDYDGDLVLAHDPLQGGVGLADYLHACRHAMVIFNVKCDGLEAHILDLVRRHRIADYFFLDVANPTLVGLARRGERSVAVRFSEFEPIEFALAFADRVDWVWVDCFTHLPLDHDSHRRLKEHFKICLVSPELQGHPRATIDAYRRQLDGMPIDAVCTDFPADWLDGGS